MKYSALKARVLEARQAGLQKLPGTGIWYCRFYFGQGLTAKYYMSNIELVYGVLPIEDVLNLQGEKYLENYRGGMEEYNVEKLD